MCTITIKFNLRYNGYTPTLIKNIHLTITITNTQTLDTSSIQCLQISLISCSHSDISFVRLIFNKTSLKTFYLKIR